MNAELIQKLDRWLLIRRAMNEGLPSTTGRIIQLCRDALAKQDQVAALSVVKESLTAENVPDLAEFARLLFAESDWPEGGGIDGCTFQDAAVECGLLVETVMHAPCGENCHCNECNAPTEKEWAAGQTCFRKSAFLMEGK